jgi:ABC-type branched-subunit amino acid transport system ATPase component
MPDVASPPATDTVIRVEGIDAGYGNIQILYDVSMPVERGKIVAIIGPNGAGKSTVLKSILGLLTPTKGQILYHGRDITGTPPHRIIAMGIGYVPQGRIVFPDMTIRDNLEMGGFTCRDKQVFDENLERCFDLFPILRDRQKQSAGTLSGGQQQMLAIGRALMSNPDTIILDEPSLGLAPKFVDTVFDTLRAMRTQGLTLLMVEQNAAKALALADHGYVLEVGRNRFEGPGRELLADEAVRRLYLGG